MIRKLLPLSVKQFFFPFFEKRKIRILEKNQKEIVKQVQGKSRIKVAFLLINQSMWKYEKLYFLLKKDSRFEPVVFICPFTLYGSVIQEQEMEQAFENFKNKGYQVVKTKNENGIFLDIKKTFQPDLVFFSNPWNHSLPQYLIHNFLDVLTGYVPYGFKNSNLFQEHFNKQTQNYCWKFFLETSTHQKLAVQYSFRKGRNTVVTGFPGTDIFLDKTYQPKPVWKKQEKLKKRIIWAPHHSVSGDQKLLDYSTFMKYADFMLEIAERFKDQLQIAFKPHPSLRGTLNKNHIWGEERTTAYYNTWKNLPNGQLEEGEYIDLFLESDAMIHDSGSFLIEYFFVKKPVLYLINSEKSKEQYNELGKKALEHLPLGYSKQDILEFINQVLVGKDEFKEKRNLFFEKNLKPPHNQTASENIYQYICNQFNLPVT